MDNIETKLSAARTRLILDKPFLGALVLRLPLKAGDPKWCKTTATDARALYYNPHYIDDLSLRQTEFVLAHEALHCALSHFARRQHRNKHRWDVACDFAINPLLIDDGLTPPPDVLYIPDYKGMTAEEIYPLIDEDTEREPHDQHLYDEEDKSEDGHGHGQGESGGASAQQGKGQNRNGGASKPDPLTSEQRENLATQWQQRMAGAAQQALQAGKLGGLMGRLVDHLLQPQLPWRMLLARYMTLQGREDFHYARPSRREGDAILPSLRSAQVQLVICIDTSGSISRPELDQFLSEVDAIKGQMKARIVLHGCDAELAPEGPWTYEAWEHIEFPARLKGGGGTRFEPVFQWASETGERPDLLLYFTDGEGQFPKSEPPYPVIWLIKGKAQVPWGQRIQLN